MEHRIYFGVSGTSPRHYLSLSQRMLWGVDFIHSYVRFEHHGVNLIYQSNGIGVHLFPFDKFIVGRHIKAEWALDMDELTYDEFIRYCYESIGTKFSNKQMFGLGLARVLGLVGNPWRRGTDGYDICSKTAGAVLKRFAGGNFGGMDPNMYAPANYFNECIRLEMAGVLRLTTMN